LLANTDECSPRCACIPCVSDRNAYMLTGALARRGYDWWWHSFTGFDAITAEARSFFIEYFSINPELGGSEAVLGQLPANKEGRRRPSYGMLNAGCWGPEPTQIHNYYPADVCAFSTHHLDARIGDATLTETHLTGAVAVSADQARMHPEWMTDAGEMSWDLTADKVLSYSVGYGADGLFRKTRAFQMFWHVAGIKTEYQGEIVFNGRRFIVEPHTSSGYQDKNWGQDFTNPWVWLNCASFVDAASGEDLPLTCLDVGGGTPVLFGRRLSSKLLIAFYLRGTLYEFNFSKFWTGARQQFTCDVDGDHIRWRITARTFSHRIEIDFSCPKDEMLFMNYENPDGVKNHHSLWNGGTAEGSVRLFERDRLIGEFLGTRGGGEYGIYGRSSFAGSTSP